MAACGSVPATVFDTQIVAGFIGMSSPSLSRLVDQMLGVSLPKADRLSDWLERPISGRQIDYAVSDVAHLLELRSVLTDRLERSAVWSGRSASATRSSGTAPRPVCPRRPGGSSGTSGACRGGAGASPRRWRPGGSAPRQQRTGLVGWCSPISDCWPSRSGRRRTREELRRTRGVDGRHLAQGRAAEILAAVRRGLTLHPTGSGCPPRAGRRRRRRPRWPSARAWCARSPTISTSTRGSWRPGPTSRSCSAVSRAGSTSGWRRTIVGDPLRRLIAGEVAAAFDRRGHLVFEERSAARSPHRAHSPRVTDGASRPAQ